MNFSWRTFFIIILIGLIIIFLGMWLFFNTNTPLLYMNETLLSIVFMALIGSVAYFFGYKREMRIFRAPPKALAAKAQLVRESGELLTRIGCGVIVKPFIRSEWVCSQVTLYPKGVLVSVGVPTPDFAIMISEICDIRYKQTRSGPQVEILHSSTEVVSPIILEVDRNNEFVQALIVLVVGNAKANDRINQAMSI
jgi:hypothetical protein